MITVLQNLCIKRKDDVLYCKLQSEESVCDPFTRQPFKLLLDNLSHNQSILDFPKETSILMGS
jgi:hypothetical protein